MKESRRKRHCISHDNVVVVGRYAYTTDLYGLTGLDLADPSAPSVVGHRGGFGGVRTAVSGDLALVCDLYGYRVVDLSDPADPTVVAFESSPAPVDAALQGSLGYVVGGTELTILDLANPADPVERGMLNLGGNVAAVTVSGNLALVSGLVAGVCAWMSAIPTTRSCSAASRRPAPVATSP